MSYTPTAIEVATRSALLLLVPSGVELIYSNQDGPRPSSATYATLLIISDAPQGLRSFETTDTAAGTGLVEQVQGQTRVFDVSVQAYGPDAYAAISRVMALYEHPAMAYAASALGISLFDCGTATRLPEELTTETEDRWVVTIRGAYYRVDALPVAALDEIVSLLQTTTDPDVAPTTQATITIEGIA